MPHSRRKPLLIVAGIMTLLAVPLGMMVREARHAALKTSDR